MPKKHKGHKNPQAKAQKELTPITVFVFSVIVGISGYILGEILLGSRPHPLHWFSGVAGVAAGYFIGWVVFRKYGDIFGW